MKLNDFYTNLLKTFSIRVTDNGFLQCKNGEDWVDITRHKGKGVALPTEENLKDMFTLDNNGKYVPKFLIFNPLAEQASEDGVGLSILQDCVKINFSLALPVFGKAMLITYTSPALQENLPMAIIDFISEAKDKNIPGMKANGKAVDESMVASWEKLILSYVQSIDKPLFNLVLPRTKKATDKNSNTREARLTCNLWVDIKEALQAYESSTEDDKAKKIEVNGVKLRYKDVKIFNDILTVFMVGANEKGAIVAGTKDTEAPGFIALMLLFRNAMGVISSYLESMYNSNPNEIKDIKIDFTFNSSDIEQSTTIFKAELTQVPTEKEVDLATDVSNAKKGMNMNLNNIHPGLQSAVEQTTVEREAAVQGVKQDVGLSATDMLLRGRNAMFGNTGMMPFNGQPAMAPVMQPVQPIMQNVQPVMAPTTAPVAPKMVSVLNPEMNTPEANQMLMARQAAAVQPQMQQQFYQQPMMNQMTYQQPMMQPMMGYPQPNVGMASPYGNSYFR